MNNLGSAEYESWGAAAFAAASDVLDVLRSSQALSDTDIELVYLLAHDILDSQSRSYVEVCLPPTGGTSYRVTATFLLDKFRQDLTTATNERLFAGIH